MWLVLYMLYIYKLLCYTECVYLCFSVQINFTVAVDFTQSNGDPRDPRSLHFIDNTGMNQYATALMSVGNIIQDYDR